MNRQIEKLYHIAKKSSRQVIGLMSGTSLDGLDIALCKLTNTGFDTQVQVQEFITLPYTEEFRAFIRQIFAQRTIDQQTLTGLNALIGITHAQLVLDALEAWKIAPESIDLIASHGQTVYHAPQSLTKDYKLPNATLQIGDADHIAVKTGIITLADFRQKHIAAGGEGAPLAAYGDYLLFSDKQENRFLLNIGGISNYTFIPSQETDLKAFATDIGPGNTMMNQYMKQHFNLEMDRDAQYASQGKVSELLLNALLEEPFLADKFPKTTGPELFNLAYLTSVQKRFGCSDLSPEDTLATLCKFAAQAICQAIEKQAEGLANCHVYISGGGLHNPLLLAFIKAGIPHISVHSFAKLGIDPDAKEAVLFALLANESVAGNPANVAAIADSPAICMGKVSLPS